jgi:thiamine-monophosphate kinase
MIDSSDGLIRSLYEVAKSSICGFEIEAKKIPINKVLREVVDSTELALKIAMAYGEDFELVFTAPREKIKEIKEDIEIDVTVIGKVAEKDIKVDGKLIENEGYTHG